VLVDAATFREDLSALADRYQRRTQTATHLLCSIAATAGCQPGTHLAADMQLPASRMTLQRCLLRNVTSPVEAPRVEAAGRFRVGKKASIWHDLGGFGKASVVGTLS
jgi:hypothetical protein